MKSPLVDSRNVMTPPTAQPGGLPHSTSTAMPSDTPFPLRPYLKNRKMLLKIVRYVNKNSSFDPTIRTYFQFLSNYILRHILINSVPDNSCC